MRKQINSRFEYFVSLGIMTEGTNCFGHSFLMLTTIDHSQKENARAEVLETAGFFSRYMPIIGYKPISRGRVKLENNKDFVNKSGLMHKTFQITQDEMVTILNAINEDRRLVGDDKPEPGTQRYKPGGPIFNLFKGNNCKQYVIELLDEIGIDTQNMHSWFEIPKLAKNMEPLRIKHAKREGKDTFYWDCLLNVSPRNANQKVTPSHQFLTLMKGVIKMTSLLQNRYDELLQQGREVFEITHTLNKILKIKNILENNQSYPNYITAKNINILSGMLKTTVLDCVNTLKKTDIEPHFVNQLLDSLKEMFLHLRNILIGRSGDIQKAKLNSNDGVVFAEMDHIYQELKRTKLG